MLLHELLHTCTKCRQQEFTWSDGIWKLFGIVYESTQKTNNNKKLSFPSALKFYFCWQRGEIWSLLSCIYRSKYSYKYKVGLFSKEVLEIKPAAVILNNIWYWLYRVLWTFTLHLVKMKSLMYGIIWKNCLIIIMIIIIIIIIATIIIIIITILIIIIK